MRRRWVTAPFVVFAAVLAAAAPAHANDAPGGSGGAFVDNDDNPTAVANDPGSAPTGGGGSDDCTWTVLIRDDFEFAIFNDDGRRLYSETGRWLQRVCDGSPQPVNGAFAVPQGGAVDPRALASSALASAPISPPAINTSPTNDRLYTQVRTWLWVDGSWWRTYSATANAGRVSSTVTATPTRAEWRTGDGGGTTCNGPGLAWRRGMSDDATYCSYTYGHSSAQQEGGKYTLTVTVWFEVTWTSNTGDSGALPAISRTASRQVEVGEVQALETG